MGLHNKGIHRLKDLFALSHVETRLDEMAPPMQDAQEDDARREDDMVMVGEHPILPHFAPQAAGEVPQAAVEAFVNSLDE